MLNFKNHKIMSQVYVKAYYNESISGGDYGHQVNILFFDDYEDYFSEEFITTKSPKEAETLARKINNKGFEMFKPIKNHKP